MQRGVAILLVAWRTCTVCSVLHGWSPPTLKNNAAAGYQGPVKTRAFERCRSTELLHAAETVLSSGRMKLDVLHTLTFEIKVMFLIFFVGDRELNLSRLDRPCVHPSHCGTSKDPSTHNQFLDLFKTEKKTGWWACYNGHATKDITVSQNGTP